MSHLVESPIKTMTTVRGRPAWLIWRLYWRIRDTKGGVYELYHEQSGARRWVMYKVYD